PASPSCTAPVGALILSAALVLAGCAAPRPPPAPPPPPPEVSVAAADPLDGGLEPTVLPATPLDVPPPPSTRRLDVRAGEPTVPVRLMEGKREVSVVPLGPVRLLLPGNPERRVEAPARTPLRIRWRSGTPAERVFRIQVAELAFADKEGIA